MNFIFFSFSPTLYVALLIYNAIIIIWKNCRKTMTSAGLHASFSLMKCFAAVKKLVDFLPDTVSVNSSFLNQDISFISDPICFGARMAQRPDYWTKRRRNSFTEIQVEPVADDLHMAIEFWKQSNSNKTRRTARKNQCRMWKNCWKI